MAVCSHSFQMDESNTENNQLDIPANKPKQALVDSTNIHRKNSHSSSKSVKGHRRHRHRASSIRRCKDSRKRHHRLSTIHSNDDNQTKINADISKDIQTFQDKQLRIQQRAMYNARQTLFIPLITDIDFSVLNESSEQQSDLLTDILTLLTNSNEECSFFGQFRI